MGDASLSGCIQRLGFSYDWDREVNTSEPSYYRWTQWIFVQMFNSWYDPEANAARPIGEVARMTLGEFGGWLSLLTLSPALEARGGRLRQALAARVPVHAREDGELFAPGLLEEVLRGAKYAPAAEILVAVRDALQAFAPQQDDMSLVVIKRR